MRVTNQMINARVVFNAQRTLNRFLKLQEQVSSGRRINKPSDDPLGIQRDLGFRNELAKNAQYRKNIGQAQSWMYNYDSILANLKNYIQTAKDLAIAMNNAPFDATARAAAANELRSIIDQVMQLANSKLQGKNIFSGFRTNVESLKSSNNGVVYNGDAGLINFQIDVDSQINVNFLGDEVFLKRLSILGQEADLNTALDSNTLLSDLNNGSGIDLVTGQFTINDLNLGVSATVDITAATTVGDLVTAINTQLAADGITNLTAQIGLEQNNIMFSPTTNGMISLSTALDKLNAGNGVDLNLGKINISDGGAIDLDIDLTGSNTLGDVVSLFNDQLASAGVSNVSLQITSQTALKIVDLNGPPLNLTVTEVDPSSTTGADLGILGFVGGLLVGRDLDPLTSFSITEAGGSTGADLGILGIFSGDFAGTDRDPLLSTGSMVADLNSGNSYALGEIVLWQGADTVTIDLGQTGITTVQDILDLFNNSGLNITASINDSGRGIQIVNNDPSKSFTIEDVGDSLTAKELNIFGSSDMMGSLIVFENALRSDNQDSVGRLLGNLDDAINNLLQVRATAGARAVRLESTHSLHLDSEASLTRLLSEIEDADIFKLLTDLAMQENAYRSSLIATSKIIQPSLVDFLR